MAGAPEASDPTKRDAKRLSVRDADAGSAPARRRTKDRTAAAGGSRGDDGVKEERDGGPTAGPSGEDDEGGRVDVADERRVVPTSDDEHQETPEETAKQVPPPSTEEEAEERRRQTEAIHHSPEDLQIFLEQARDALLAEGFQSTPMQYRKKNQVFGVVKEHGHDLQLHVRAFANGVIESEVELSNKYIQHLWSPRRSAHAEITMIFEKHGVMTETINTEFRTRTGADRDQMPRMLTKTTDVVKAGVGIAGAVGAVAIARLIQRRNPPKKGRPWR